MSGRRRLAWVMLALLPLLSLRALGDQEGDFVYQTNGGGAVVTAYAGLGGAVVIPDTLGGLPVRMIGALAFEETNVTSVTIPNSVTNIDSDAFLNCTSLSNVTIPNGLISIGDYAFVRCESLTNVVIGPGIVSIGALAFGYCDSLRAITVDPLNSFYTSVDGVLFDKNTNTLLQVPGGKSGSYEIPTSVTNIAHGAFIDCTRLTRITVPDTVTSIGYLAFYGCTGLRSVTIPDGVTSIQGETFRSCVSLKSITIPDSVTSIGDYAFFGCTGLTNVVIGSGVTRTGDEAFEGCTGLTSITIPNSVTLIESYAFADCTGLTNVAIGSGVTTIEDDAFRGCTGLRTMIIPGSVTTIHENAFAYCPRLTGLYFEGNAPPIRPAYPLFESSPFVTVFYRPGTTGWGSTYADRPTALWVERPGYADWAVATGLNAQFPAASGEGDDADGDGFTNGAEWFAGTDPTQSASRLELELAPRPADLTASDQTPVPAGQRAVYFRSVPGRYYGVQSATDLSGAWTLAAVRIASTTETRFVLPASGSQDFYRVLALP